MKSSYRALSDSSDAIHKTQAHKIRSAQAQLLHDGIVDTLASVDATSALHQITCFPEPTPKYHRHWTLHWRMLPQGDARKKARRERTSAGVGFDAPIAHSLFERLSWTFVVSAERWVGCTLSPSFANLGCSGCAQAGRR